MKGTVKLQQLVCQGGRFASRRGSARAQWEPERWRALLQLRPGPHRFYSLLPEGLWSQRLTRQPTPSTMSKRFAFKSTAIICCCFSGSSQKQKNRGMQQFSVTPSVRNLLFESPTKLMGRLKKSTRLASSQNVCICRKTTLKIITEVLGDVLI